MLTAAHEREVYARFDVLEARFRADVGLSDVRLRSVRDALDGPDGRRILDLGCGKGRFAAYLRADGAEVVGLDLSAKMLGRAQGLDRVRGSALRLPFAASAFDGVAAVEVFEHLPPDQLDNALIEIRRVLKPGGRLVIVDKHAGSLNASRPWLPALVVKWIDERRGLWMYPPGGPVREHWFWPESFRRRLGRHFGEARLEYLLSPDEAGRRVFRLVPRARRLVAWTARAIADRTSAGSATHDPGSTIPGGDRHG